MPVKNFILHPVFIKTVIVLWFLVVAVSINVQSAELSSEKTSKQLTEKPERALEPESLDTEEIPAESTQEKVEYDIDKKEHPDNPCDRDR